MDWSLPYKTRIMTYNLSDNGWIKLHRKLRNNPLMKKPAYLSVFINLLMEAEHGMIKDGETYRKKVKGEFKRYILNGKDVELLSGQLTAGIRQIADWTGVPMGTVKRILDVLENETMIETLKTSRFTLYTIKNWTMYQESETLNETLMKNKRNSNETTYKNVKNERIKEVSTNVDMSKDYDFSSFVEKLNELNVFDSPKLSTDSARAKYKTRCKTFTDEQLLQAFSNLKNERDQWQLKNNGFRPLSWWLEKDDRIEQMLNIHLKSQPKSFTRYFNPQIDGELSN